MACQGFNVSNDFPGTGDAASQKSTRDDDGDGESPADGDCDDTDPDVYSSAPERCDGVDNDCNDLVDDDDPNRVGLIWMFDGDSDGYGNDNDDDGFANYQTGCDPDEWADIVENATGDTGALAYYVAAQYDADDNILVDCNDDNEDVNPGEAEVCDALDNDCNDLVDDGVSTPTAFYADVDEDTFGDAGSSVTECEMSAGYVVDDSDCDDTNAAINPAASEVCDSMDNDCDDLTDDADDSTDVSSMSSWYVDDDDDGYGDPPPAATACEDPTGGNLVTNADDCDDSNASINPAATEICDELNVDEDCNGMADDSDTSGASGMTDWYLDGDSDTYGDPSFSTTTCDQPSGYVADWTDCNDSNSAINPAASEVCDSVDNDCDGLTDDSDASVDTSTGSAFYADMDSDSFGNASVSTMACLAPSSYVSDSSDCDDTSSSTYPGATEMCDLVDNDCDGTADEGVETTFYADADADNYGNASVTESACEASSGYVSDATDCDDTDTTVNPGADEYCDDVDDDCDGSVDEDAVDQTTWSRDRDEDGYGDPDAATFTSCDAPSGYVESSGDCDDTDAEVNPAATEVFNEYDDDCDGEVDEGTSCATVIEILNDGGEATSISGIVSDDSALDGEWYPGGVSGVSVTPTSLGGDDWMYEIAMDLCITTTGSVIVDAEFEDGSSLCESMASTGLIDAFMDEIELDVLAFDNGDGTCSTQITR